MVSFVSRRMAHALVPVASLLFTTAPHMALAQDGNVTELEGIVISAAGVETNALTAPASVTVVTREQLEKLNVVDLTDALRGVPGVSVAGAADGTNIFIRGLPSEYTVIMVDGQRQDTRASRTNAAGGIDQLYIPPVSAIERIEIVRGPMSALHGSDAMGGVINIITRPPADKWTGSVTAEASIPESDKDSRERQLSFYASGPIVAEKIGAQIWGRFYDRTESERLEPNPRGDLVNRGPSERDFRDIRGRFTWTPRFDQNFWLELGQAKIETDPRLDTRTNAGVGYRGVIGGWDATANLYHERAERETDGSDRNPRIDNTIFDPKLSRSFDFMGGHRFTFGGQVAYSELTDQNPGLGDSRQYSFTNTQWALFAEDIWDLHPNFTLTLGGRHVDDQRFGSKFTPRIYGLLKLADGLYLSAGAATGYRTPELREAAPNYFSTTNQGRAVIPGNPDLLPEESTSYEVGLRYRDERRWFTATAFHTDLKNRIENRDTGERIVIGGQRFGLFEYFNVGQARIKGLELTAGTFLVESLKFDASYTLTDSERLTGDLIGLPLARTPEHQASARLDWTTPVSGLNLWGSVQYFGETVSISSSSRGSTATFYDGYTTLDLGAKYDVNEHATVQATVYNVTDAEITDNDHGGVRNGRTYWIALTGRF